MSGQRARSAIPVDHRSVHPNVPGAPWWGAVIIAVTWTSVGFAFDAGGGTGELSGVFATMYVIGCVAAVLMVRQSGIFTAVVQPPVLLFITVPGAYYLFHGSDINGLKDILITCGYPLVVRFPLMLFTSAAVLLIGLFRWYVGISARTSGNASGDAEDSDDAPKKPRRRHAVDRRNGEPSPSPRAARPTNGQPTRGRSGRNPAVDREPPLDRPDRTDRQERPRRSRSGVPWPEDSGPEPRRRRQPTTGPARDPYGRREPYERRAPHDRLGRVDTYDPFEAYESPARRRPGTNGSTWPNGAGTGTHHPINQVRYRGAAKDRDQHT